MISKPGLWSHSIQFVNGMTLLERVMYLRDNDDELGLRKTSMGTVIRMPFLFVEGLWLLEDVFLKLASDDTHVYADIFGKKKRFSSRAEVDDWIVENAL